MRSSVFVNDLRLYAYHGVLPQERRVGAWFRVSLTVYYDFCRAMETDAIDDTISYADVCQVVCEEMAVPSALLEHVAGRLIKALRRRWPQIETVSLTLTKENPPMGVACSGAGVSVTG